MFSTVGEPEAEAENEQRSEPSRIAAAYAFTRRAAMRDCDNSRRWPARRFASTTTSRSPR